MTVHTLRDEIQASIEFGEQLLRLEERRRGGIPTICTLVGPVGVSRRIWADWSRDLGCEVVNLNDNPDDWVRTWIESVVGTHNLYDIALGRLADALMKSREEIAERLSMATSKDLHMLLSRARFDKAESDVNGLCARILISGTKGVELSQRCDIALSARKSDFDQPRDTELLKSLLRLVSEERAPTLLVEAADDRRTNSVSGAGGLLASQCRAAVLLATQIPELRLGFAVEAGTWKEHVECLPDSFTKAALGENRVSVQGWSPERVAERFRTQIGIDLADPLSDVSRPFHSPTEPSARQMIAAVRTVTKIGATQELVDSLCDAIRTSTTVGRSAEPPLDGTETNSESGPWKSAQERFLFELLDHHAQLGGLFRLNADPGFKFGNRRAEVDLLCQSLAIAIEIDGYYHFTDAECYRRDRRKDLSLQQHGFLVLRFLAEDVVPEIEHILETILAVVDSRRQSSELRREEGKR